MLIPHDDNVSTEYEYVENGGGMCITSSPGACSVTSGTNTGILVDMSTLLAVSLALGLDDLGLAVDLTVAGLEVDVEVLVVVTTDFFLELNSCNCLAAVARTCPGCRSGWTGSTPNDVITGGSDCTSVSSPSPYISVFRENNGMLYPIIM